MSDKPSYKDLQRIVFNNQEYIEKLKQKAEKLVDALEELKDKTIADGPLIIDDALRDYRGKNE